MITVSTAAKTSARVSTFKFDISEKNMFRQSILEAYKTSCGPDKLDDMRPSLQCQDCIRPLGSLERDIWPFDFQG